MAERGLRSFRLFRPERARAWASADWALLAGVVCMLDLMLMSGCGSLGTVSLPGSALAAGLAWWGLVRRDTQAAGRARAVAWRVVVMLAAAGTTMLLLVNIAYVYVRGITG